MFLRCLFKQMFFFGLLFGDLFLLGRFLKTVFRWAKIPRKKPSQSIGQQRIQPAKKPGKVQQKIDTNFKTTTRRLSAPPRFWVVVLKFESILLKNLAGLFGWAFLSAGFFAGLCFGMAFSLEFWPIEKNVFKRRAKKHFFQRVVPPKKSSAKKPSQVLQKIDSNFKTTTQKRGGAL